MRLTSSLVALGAIVAVLIAAGCGGSKTASTDEYAQSVIDARDRVEFALTQITVGKGDVHDLIDRMETAADRIDEAASTLDDAGVAQGFEDETDKLVVAFHQLASALAGTAHDAGQPGMEGLLTGTNALQFPGWTQANRILNDLAGQGIDVQPIGSN